MPALKTIQVVAALLRNPKNLSEILIQQRLATKARPNKWEFPGGKIEPGESAEAALARECVEELAVQVRVGARVWQTTHAYDDVIVALQVFEARLVSGEPQCLGAQAIRYASPAAMASLPFCEADAPLLEALQAWPVPRE